MWFKFGYRSLDLSDVSNVSLEGNAVVVTMKGGQQIVFYSGRNVTPEELYESITDLLEEMTERDDRYRENTLDIFKKTLSELELISKELTSISQSLRK